jgi:hypothetical protein
LQADEASLRIQKDLVDEKQKLLNVPSPMDGQVISWQVKQQLENRPVSRQQILMEVANLNGDWELELLMPESRMGHVQRAWDEAQKTGTRPKVTFFLAQGSSEKFTGELVDIDLSAHARAEKGNSVRLRVSFDQQAVKSAIKDMKVNSTAIAKVHCGTASIGYKYLHDLIDFVRAKILFRL